MDFKVKYVYHKNGRKPADIILNSFLLFVSAELQRNVGGKR